MTSPFFQGKGGQFSEKKGKKFQQKIGKLPSSNKQQRFKAANRADCRNG